MIISRIEGCDEQDMHRRMLDAFAKFQQENNVQADEKPDLDTRLASGPNPRAPRAMSRAQVAELRAMVDYAGEIFDLGRWRPLSDNERSAIQAVLRHVAQPRTHELPLR
jgi:hypothetical protein